MMAAKLGCHRPICYLLTCDLTPVPELQCDIMFLACEEEQ